MADKNSKSDILYDVTSIFFTIKIGHGSNILVVAIIYTLNIFFSVRENKYYTKIHNFLKKKKT